jgi:dihydroorotase
VTGELTNTNGTKPLALINGRVIDPASGLDEAGGVITKDGRIEAAGAKVTKKTAPKAAEVIDCRGAIICPGLIDMQVYTGEPGREHRETFASASEAAAAGGVTTIITMPNATPVIDNVALVDFIERRARDTSIVNVHPMAALTIGLEGEQISEIGMLKEAGAAGFSDGSHTIQNSLILRRALEYAKQFGALLSVHAQDADLAGSGVMNEGEVATRLGLAGIPAAAEAIIVERYLHLVELTGARLHIAQVSARASVEAVRKGKQRGLGITCGVSAPHLLLNENDIGSYRTFVKLSPPLRTEDDRQALIEGLSDGTIDVIVSSHNPQSADTKRHPFAEAAAGAIGLETLLASALALYHAGDIKLERLIETLTGAPARILEIDAGTLKPGAPADICVMDPEQPWIVELADLRSKSKNTPFEKHKFLGRCIRTIVAGRSVYEPDTPA